LWITALIIVIGSVEVVVVGFLAHRFLPVGLARTLDGVGLLLLVGTSWAVASVLWRRHRIRAGELRLVLGHLGQICVPRSAVGAVIELPALRAQDSHLTGPTLVGETLNLAAATGMPRVEVSFVEPIIGRRLWQRRRVLAVVVTDPERLIPRTRSRAIGSH
jgi:hypothetical protein